jgi:hypothetical protein
MNKEDIKINDVVWVKIVDRTSTVVYEGPTKVAQKLNKLNSRGLVCKFPLKIIVDPSQTERDVLFVYFSEMLFKIK